MTREINNLANDEKMESCERNDLAQGRSLFLLWGPPIVLSVIASFSYSSGWLPLTSSALFWTVSTAWIGTLCLFNARGCGRVHCAIIGSLFPLLSIAGILGLLGIIPFDWGYYEAVFLAIVIGSFVAECVWRPNLRASRFAS